VDDREESIAATPPWDSVSVGVFQQAGGEWLNSLSPGLVSPGLVSPVCCRLHKHCSADYRSTAPRASSAARWASVTPVKPVMSMR
jgi:hypothetical protein